MSKEWKGWENFVICFTPSTRTAHMPITTPYMRTAFPSLSPFPDSAPPVLCFLLHCLCPFLKFFFSLLTCTTFLAHKALLCAKNVTTYMPQVRFIKYGIVKVTYIGVSLVLLFLWLHIILLLYDKAWNLFEGSLLDLYLLVCLKMLCKY